MFGSLMKLSNDKEAGTVASGLKPPKATQE